MTPMKRSSHKPIILISLALVWMIGLAGCTGPKSSKANTAAASDSTAAVDSTANLASPVATASLSYEEQQGKVLYIRYCAVCHGEGGKGDGFNAYNLDPKPRDFTDPRAMAGIDDATLLATITEGGKGVSKSPLMPAWGGRMDKLQMQYVVAYVKALESQH